MTGADVHEIGRIGSSGGTVTVTAGGAYSVDPTLTSDPTTGTIATSEDFEVTSADGIYTVTAMPPIARIVSADGATTNEYATLSKALAALQANETLELYAGSFEIPATTVLPAGVTLTGAGTNETTLAITTTNGDGLKITNAGVTISNMTIDGSAITSSGYNSLINVEADGAIIDGVVMTGGGTSTWNSSILVERINAPQTFTVKNSTISGSFRGVLRESCNANIVIENCDIDAVYPFNIDGGNGGTVTVTDSALHGWTSYSGVDSVTFTNCEFSKGKSGYDVVAAYVNTTFDGCSFDSNFDIYAQTANFTFTLEDCTKNGTDLTWENFPDNFTDSDVWNKCTCLVESIDVASIAKVIPASGDEVYYTTFADASAAAIANGGTVYMYKTPAGEEDVGQLAAGQTLKVQLNDQTVVVKAVGESVVAASLDETTGVTTYSSTAAVASITLGEGDEAVTTYYTSFADAITAAEAYAEEHDGAYPQIKVIDTSAVPPADWKIVDGYLVKKGYVAQIVRNDEVVGKYEAVAAALAAVQDGDTIVVLGAAGNESGTEIAFDRTGDIAFTITGNAPDYGMPIVTFADTDGSGGKITVTIKDAKLAFDELDARQNATINVVDSFIVGKGGNTIVKSYFNGAVNISGTSKVYTMQVTTTGYITISDTAELTATWQTSVLCNGLLTVAPGAKFNTAALQLTGKAYSGRDNTDADRVGKPATLVVDGATLNVGWNAYSSSGADYNYNSSGYGINIGTVDGKSAVLDIKNASTVVMAQNSGNGTYDKKVTFGAGATVNVTGGSTLTVRDRGSNGVTLTNGGTITLDKTSSVTTPDFASNAGSIAVDATGITAPVKVIDCTGTGVADLAGYGTVTVTGGVAYVEDGDLWVNVRYVAQIGDVKYETFVEAIAVAEAYAAEHGGEYPQITVLDTSAEPPADWKFVTDTSVEPPVTTLVRKAYVAQIGTTKYETLAAAVTAAQTAGGEVTITLLTDISGASATATIPEVANLKLTIDGAKADGGRYAITDATLTIDGKRATGGGINNGASVTLQNIDFAKTTDTAEAVKAINYPHDVTVRDCSFAGTSENNNWWAISATNDAAYYWTLENIAFENCRMLNCKSFDFYNRNAEEYPYGLYANALTGTSVKVGINNIKTGNAVLIENVSISAEKYAFRDAPEAYAGIITIKNSSFTSASTAEDEGALVVRGGATTASVNVESGAYSGQIVILNDKQDVLNISGGIFSADPTAYVVENHAVVENPDAETKDAYPYAVVSNFTVTFVNYDNTVLFTTNVPVGATAVYVGETPAKPADASNVYAFSGWDPEITAVTDADQTYTAQFTPGAPVAKIGDAIFGSLQAALDAAHEKTGDVTVTLLADITEVAVVHQKAGLNLTIDGDGNTITGQIYIDGNGRYNGEDTLTIQNVKFAYDAATYDDAFINAPNTKTTGKVYTTGAYNYAHNVTVSNCEFAGSGETTVAFRVASGSGAHNVNLTDLTVTGGHSVAQLVGVKDLTITGCTATGVKNGINISGGAGTGTISDTTISAQGYTVRLKDASGMAVSLADNTFSGSEGIISNASSGGTITVESGAYNGALGNSADKLIIKGGIYSDDPATFVAEGYAVIANPDEETNAEYPYAVVAIFNVKFVNWDESVLFTTNVAVGGTAVYEGETPTKPDDAQNVYTFIGWDPEITAVTDAEQVYTAQFSTAAPVAKVGDKYFPTLTAAAGEAGAGDTITLLADIADEGAVALGAGVTLDGDGHKVSGDMQIAVDAAGGTVKNVAFDGIGTRTAPVAAITTANGLAGELAVTNCTFTNDGYVKTDIVVKPVAGAKVAIVDNMFSGLSGTAVVVDPASEDAVDYEATVTGNVFKRTATATRAFAVVGAADAEKLALDGNYIANGLHFGASADGENVSEIAYKMLETEDAEEATVELPTFIIKRTASDGYPTLAGFETLAAAVADAKAGETVFVTADAELTEAVVASKDVTVDGQGKTLAASGDWSLKGGSGTLTLTDATLAFADGDYAAARLGDNVVLGDGVTIDASAVTAAGALYATGVTVSDGAAVTVVAGSVQAGQTLISGLAGDTANLTVTDLPAGVAYAVADDALVLLAKVARIGDVYYDTLQAAVDAAQEGDVVEVVADVTLPAEGLEILKNITVTGATDADGKPLYTISGPADSTAEVYVGSPAFDADVTAVISNLAFDSAAVVFEGWTEDSKLTLDNVEFANYDGYAVESVGLGTLEMTNSAIDGGGTAGGVYAKFGDVTVANTEIANVVDGVVADTDALVTLGDGVAVGASGAAVKVADGGAVSVTGGTYSGALDGADGVIAVTGGHFSEDPSAYVSEGYTTVPGDPDGYDVIQRMADGLQIVVAEEGYVYNGEAHEVAVKDSTSGAALAEGTDYTVEYDDNVNAGTVHVTVTGLGRYTGVAETNFVIA
ncbi:MAG: hypothetical protein IJJ84_07230, partial [Kiritimatiellae bacterium]|nr:hypothetical protein [Kiritimatiellia bacterium]